MLLEEHGMLLRGGKHGQGAPNGVVERLSSGAAIRAEHRRKGSEVKSLECNRGASNRGRRGD